MPQCADVAAAYVCFGDKFAAGPTGTCVPVKCQTRLNASSLFGPAGTTKFFHLVLSFIVFRPLLFFFF